MAMKEVSRKEFEKKTKKLQPITKMQIENALSVTGKEITKFLYGNASGNKTYKIVYSDGMTRTWITD